MLSQDNLKEIKEIKKIWIEKIFWKNEEKILEHEEREIRYRKRKEGYEKDLIGIYRQKITEEEAKVIIERHILINLKTFTNLEEKKRALAEAKLLTVFLFKQAN